MSDPLSNASSDFIPIRGLRYHVRRWGADDAPTLLLVHGWMDVSATFAPVAQRLAARFRVLIPDWRGFGLTQWPQDGYWFADYVADLDALVDHYSPQAPLLLAGHSMGSTAVAHFAGLRPQRVSKLAILDGLALPNGDPGQIVKVYRRWLNAVKTGLSVPSYPSFEVLAARVSKRNPKLGAAHCLEIARAWGQLGDDGLVRLASDPRHLLNMPRSYQQAESDAIWACVEAETLFIDGGASPFAHSLPAGEPERRRQLFRRHRRVVIEDAGHMLHFEAPAALADHLADFFSA